MGVDIPRPTFFQRARLKPDQPFSIYAYFGNHIPLLRFAKRPPSKGESLRQAEPAFFFEPTAGEQRQQTFPLGKGDREQRERGGCGPGITLGCFGCMQAVSKVGIMGRGVEFLVWR
jgi:hypothetical protein